MHSKIPDPDPAEVTVFTALIALCVFVAALLGAPSADAAGLPVFATSYTPEAGQTDHTPCTGAPRRPLCLAAREGDRTIALSRALLWFRGGPYRWHEKVRVTSHIPQCNGVYSVEDTMNRRW